MSDPFETNNKNIVRMFGLDDPGRAGQAASIPMVLSQEDFDKLEALRVLLAAMPTAASGATAANQTTALSRMPSALGQTTASGSLPVVIASNQSAVPVDANAYELLTNWQSIPGDSQSHQILGSYVLSVATVDIRKDNPTTNGGTTQNTQVGGFTGSSVRRTLVVVPDLSPYAAYTLESATLSMYNQDISNTVNPALGPIQVFRILPANAGWTELDVAWNYRSIASLQAWAGATPGMVAGVDFATTQMASQPFTAYSGSSNPYWMHWSLDPTEFNLLRANNAGMVIKLQNESAVDSTIVRFDSDESPTVANRPYLTLVLRPPELATIALSRVREVYVQAEGDNIFISNGLSASSSHLRLISGQVLRLRTRVDGSPLLSAYVPTGSTLKYQFAGVTA